MEWCVVREGVEHIFHYLDDFAVVGPPDSDTCMLYLHKLKSICIELGIPLATRKTGWSHTSDHTAGDYYRHNKRRVETSRGQTTEVAAGSKRVGKM